MSDWRTIDTAPKDGTLVDLWCVHTTFPPGRSANMRWFGGEWREAAPMIWGLNPGWHATHWMPLPEPPGATATA